MTERLVAAALQRNGEIYSCGFREHWRLRAALDPECDSTKSIPGDVEGFVTSTGRFVTREEAVPVGLGSGQLHNSWKDASRALLSSDINW